jgi:hypothetical protein
MSDLYGASRETDNVLLRLPSTLKTQAVTVAEKGKVSANALYAAGVLYATLIYGPVPRIGNPANILAFIEEMDEAALGGAPVVGGFDKADWDDVAWILADINGVGWVKDVKVRTDTKASSTIVYTYRMTKVGRALWPRFGDALRRYYGFSSSKSKEEGIPA